MKTWERVAYVASCGGCGEQLARNTPILTLRLPGIRRPLIRCEECAGPAPPDLPATPERARSTKPMTPIAKSAPKTEGWWQR